MSTATIRLTDLEAMIRRVIREELAHHALSVLDDWSQEGPDDRAGDEESLADALVVLEEYKDRPEAWADWEDFKAELARAEAAGELPD
jgi:hypothetical protein